MSTNLMDELPTEQIDFYWVQVQPSTLNNSEFLDYVKNALPNSGRAAQKLLEVGGDTADNRERIIQQVCAQKNMFISLAAYK